MNPQYNQQVLYDLALAISGESDQERLTRSLLQRLLYHTGFSSGLLVRAEGEPGNNQAQLLQTVGTRGMRQHIGKLFAWPSGALHGGNALHSPAFLPEKLQDGNRVMTHSLRLEAGERLRLFLYSDHLPSQPESLTSLFDPILLRFARAYDLCGRADEQKTQLEKIVQELTNERDQTEIALKESESRFRLMADSAPVLIWIADKDKVATWFNQTALAFMGRKLEQVIGKGWLESVHPEDLQRCSEQFIQHFDRREPFHTEFRIKYFDGTYRWILDSGTPCFDDQGNFVGYVGSAIDINDRVAAEAKLRTLSTAIEQSPTSVLITDTEAKIEYVNPRFSEVTGYTAEEAIGQNPRMFQSGLTSKETYLKLWDKVTNGQIWHGELLNKRKNGEIYWEEAHISPVKNEAGKLTHFVATKIEITQRKLNEEAILQSEERFRFILEHSPVAVRIANVKDSRVMFANPRYAELIGSSMHEVIGCNVKHYYADVTDYDEVIEQVKTGERVFDRLVKLRIPGEPVQTKWALASYLKLDYQNEPAVLAWFYDISDRIAMEEKVRHLANHDPLTDLPNRTLFTDRLQRALSIAKRDKTHLALMFIDLDKFKPINDSLGHNMGDLLLKETAKRMQHCVRESDTVARIGGDEFVVLLPIIESPQDAILVAEKIRQAINKPFVLLDQSMNISSSTGIAIYPEHGNNERQLLKNADSAMYYAKESGRNKAILYQAERPSP